MPKVVLTEKAYDVKKKDVFLSLLVGDGQFGRSDVFLDDTKIIRATGDITGLRLGNGAELDGKTLKIHTLGVDVNTDTNRLDVSYELRGGDGVLEFTASDKVASEFGSIMFSTKVSLAAA
jgi:hypothetical protein